ncbi:MAG TPA: tRNA (adenosine(37)-N6)-threonylcarbamoyltransferase complex ATPase subunit type 1 TsaE [Pseudonocardiaceae bacterium]|nr:tRNA (adenosine(37)-N6)-threonylcarbamoyltransferase complex ATPase subunit type 1 TsaE [Pseudonocardiaceae bacterium]
MVLELVTPADTERLGRAVGERLCPGDVVVLSGPLGAGKTVLARGIGAGLGVRGPVTSPTFVIAREHPPLPGGRGVPLVHVDAYRLGGMAELDDLDLDTDLLAAAVVVEWGEGMAERLSEEHLLIRLHRPGNAGDEDRRVAQLSGPARLIPEPAALMAARGPEMGDP